MAVKSWTVIDSRESRIEDIIEATEVFMDTVGATMGAKGRNVLMEPGYGDSWRSTKDGVQVAKSIKVKSKIGQAVGSVIKEASGKTAEKAGDGTTTTVVIAGELIKRGTKMLSGGANPMGICRGMDMAHKIVDSELKGLSKKVSGKKEIEQIATVSSNWDKSIGEAIAEAIEKVGRDGVITVEESSKGEGIELEVVAGLQFDKGYISPYFVTDTEKMKGEFEDAFVLIYDKKISGLQPILPILEGVMQSGRPLIIIAEDIEGEALATLILNKMRGGLKVCAVKAPAFGDRRKAILEDIAIVVGGQLISEELGMKLETVTLDMLGKARKIVVTKDDTRVVGGKGKSSDIEIRCKQLRKMIDDSTSDYDKDKLKERLAKLTGGIAVLKVGGVTEAEVKERKDRVEDAYHATKAAIEEGIVAGGGVALLYASRALEKLKVEDEDEKAGVNIVMNAMRGPIERILKNAGIEGAVVVEKLREKKDKGRMYDVQKCEYVDAYDAGIIDPTKVVRTALESAIAAAKLLLTTEKFIYNESEGESGGGSMGGHGGMGGMDY